MIDYDEIKNVINNLDKYVSSLKHITETQSTLQKSNEELIDIKKELDSLINEIRHFAELTKQTEQMRTEVLQKGLISIADKVAIIQEQFNEIRHFAELTKQTEQMRTEVLQKGLISIADKVAIIQEQFNELYVIKDNISIIIKQQSEIEIKAQRRFKTLLGAILGSAGIIFIAFVVSVLI